MEVPPVGGQSEHHTGSRTGHMLFLLFRTTGDFPSLGALKFVLNGKTAVSILSPTELESRKAVLIQVDQQAPLCVSTRVQVNGSTRTVKVSCIQDPSGSLKSIQKIHDQWEYTVNRPVASPSRARSGTFVRLRVSRLGTRRRQSPCRSQTSPVSPGSKWQTLNGNWGRPPSLPLGGFAPHSPPRRRVLFSVRRAEVRSQPFSR